jgi:uncharacterized protein CbrC (UPF0167 family)
MSHVVFESNDGSMQATDVAARCDACARVARAIQYTGPHGYVTLCPLCMAEIQVELLRISAARRLARND